MRVGSKPSTPTALSALPGLCLRLLERRSARGCWGWHVAVATRYLQGAAPSASGLLGTGEGTPGNLRPGRTAEGVWSRGAARPKRGRERAGDRDQRRPHYVHVEEHS